MAWNQWNSSRNHPRHWTSTAYPTGVSRTWGIWTPRCTTRPLPRVVFIGVSRTWGIWTPRCTTRPLPFVVLNWRVTNVGVWTPRLACPERGGYGPHVARPGRCFLLSSTGVSQTWGYGPHAWRVTNVGDKGPTLQDTAAATCGLQLACLKRGGYGPHVWRVPNVGDMDPTLHDKMTGKARA